MDVNDKQSIDQQTMLKLGQNLVAVAAAKGIQRLDSLTRSQWLMLWETRIGHTPIFTLAFSLVKTMNSHGILLAEVASDNPTYFVQCLQQGNLLPYYTQHPQGSTLIPTAVEYDAELDDEVQG